ncbi:MAG: hypothetical protein J4F98_13140 [Acidobacteria bacterium]|nr:hypothetical protein [Acidobacteriota bacterium]
MPVEAAVAPVRQQPPVFGVGLEQQPEQDPEAQAVGIAEISGCARAGLPVERVRHSDRQPGNNMLIDSLAQATPEIGRELSGLVEQVDDGSFTGKRGGREDEIQVGGVVVVQGCKIEFQPGLDATAAPHAHARLGRVEAELVASHENQPDSGRPRRAPADVRYRWSIGSVREEPWWRRVCGLACLDIGRGRFVE